VDAATAQGSAAGLGPVHAYLGLLLLVAAERVLELAVSCRNARRALARGGVETGRGHYGAMVILHLAFLPALAAGALLRPAPPPPAAWLAVAAVASAQALRWWAVASLGDRWSTRVIVVPGEAPVTRGPYRVLRHPNYVAVIAEMAFLPLAWGLWPLAVLFSAANAAVLRARIREEERALGPEWARAFAGKARFLPGARARGGGGA
jgi:methyltransferase